MGPYQSDDLLSLSKLFMRCSLQMITLKGEESV